jgi:type I restriction enzyme S subunit
MNESGNERYMAKCTSFLNEKDVASLGLGAFPRGTVIFPKRGGAIATNKKRELVRDSCVDLNTMALIPLEAIGPYLWWWFSSIDLGSLSDGSNVPQINHSDINPLSVPLPPIKEQLAKSSAV